MTRLRFIKSWGPYKPGDIKENPSGSTIHWLVDVYKFAVIELAPPPAPAPALALAPDLYKYVRKPQRDKMVTRPKAAK